MGMTEWQDAYGLLDTAKKLVVQAHNILARDDFSDSWLEDLQDIDWKLEEYLSEFVVSWLEGCDD